MICAYVKYILFFIQKFFELQENDSRYFMQNGKTSDIIVRAVAAHLKV